MSTNVINIDPEVMGGTPVFSGTRVPIQTFADYIVSSTGIKGFFDDFPSVSQEQVLQLLDEVKEEVVVAA